MAACTPAITKGGSSDRNSTGTFKVTCMSASSTSPSSDAGAWVTWARRQPSIADEAVRSACDPAARTNECRPGRTAGDDGCPDWNAGLLPRVGWGLVREWRRPIVRRRALSADDSRLCLLPVALDVGMAGARA